jgi:hypothetical protein
VSNLLLGDLDLLEGGRDLLEGEVALLASARDQALELIGLDEVPIVGSSLQFLWRRP